MCEHQFMKVLGSFDAEQQYSWFASILGSTTHFETHQTTKAKTHNHCHNHYQYLFNCNRKTIWL